MNPLRSKDVACLYMLQAYFLYIITNALRFSLDNFWLLSVVLKLALSFPHSSFSWTNSWCLISVWARFQSQESIEEETALLQRNALNGVGACLPSNPYESSSANRPQQIRNNAVVAFCLKNDIRSFTPRRQSWTIFNSDKNFATISQIQPYNKVTSFSCFLIKMPRAPHSLV